MKSEMIGGGVNELGPGKGHGDNHTYNQALISFLCT